MDRIGPSGPAERRLTARTRIPVGGHGDIGVSKKADAKGNYRAWVTVRESSSRTRELTAFGATQGKAKTRLRARILEWQNSGKVLTSRANVEAVVNAWLNSRSVSDAATEGDMSSQTRAAYDYYARKYINPGIGRALLTELRASDVQKFLTGLIMNGGGHTNARLCKTILSQAFDFAILDDVVAANPVKSVKLPSKTRPKPRALTDEELLARRTAIRDWRTGPGLFGPPKSEHLQDLFEVMLGSALRVGEALALKWEDIDLVAKSATVHATLVEERPSRDVDGVMQPGRFCYQDWRKSGREALPIELPDFVCDIPTHRKITSPALNPEGAVFVTRKGRWVRMSSMRRSFNAAKGAAGLAIAMDWSTPHTLRKTALTRLARMKDAEEAAIQTGHSDVRIAETYYLEREQSHARNGEVLQTLAPGQNGLG